MLNKAVEKIIGVRVERERHLTGEGREDGLEQIYAQVLRFLVLDVRLLCGSKVRMGSNYANH